MPWEDNVSLTFLVHTSAAKERAAATGEFHEREGLGEVIVGAAVKGNNLIKLGIFCRKHHDGHRCGFGIGAKATP